MTIISGTITQGDDNIVTDGADDRLDALAGNDTVLGKDGNDSLFGNFGNDSLLGGNDNDSLLGGDQRDTIDGENGNDTLDGGNDNDSLFGGTGNNLVNGGTGNDTLIVASGNDFLLPGEVGDTLFGGEGVDELRAEGSDYVLTNNTLRVSKGGVNNFLIHQLPVSDNKTEGAIERVSLTGNVFPNTVDASGSLFAGQTSLFGLEGSDTIIGSQGLDGIFGGDSADSLVGGAGFNSIDGNDGNDTLIGGDDDNNLEGGAGNDFIQGGTEGDTFIDLINSGAGDDLYIGEEGDDLLFVSGGEQFSSENISFRLASSSLSSDNSVLTGGRFQLGGNLDDSATGTDTLEKIETVNILGTEGINRIDAVNFNGDVILRGFGGSDILLGGRGNDILDGDFVFTGNDSLSGGLGNDTLDGGTFGGDTDTLTGGRAFNGVGSADTFDILVNYIGTGHAVIDDFSIQDGDKLRLQFLSQGSSSDFTFVQQNFSNSGTGTNSSALLDTVVFFGSPAAGDIITVVEDVSINPTTPGVEIFG
jgi:Ca2+-binding RTX toxin-like protein